MVARLISYNCVPVLHLEPGMGCVLVELVKVVPGCAWTDTV